MYIWYKIVRSYVKWGLFFYFKKIQVVGEENIPKNKAVLFTANHRNGLIDPILIATAKPKVLHFLTRASAFKNSIASFLLHSINMLPIYRIRDGIDSIAKNQAIFEACFEIFKKKESVLIFPEGNHGYPRKVRPLSKGFTRIAFGFLNKYPDQELWIIPVGVNYSDIIKPFEKVSVYYGKPILVNDYNYLANENESIETLKTKVFNELALLTVHIDHAELHDKIVEKLISEGDDFTQPFITNNRVKELLKNEIVIKKISKKSKTIVQHLLYSLFYINSFLPILIWKKIKPTVKDIVMLSTYRFGVSVALFPFFYILQALLMSIFLGLKLGFLYLFFSLILTLIRKYFY